MPAADADGAELNPKPKPGGLMPAADADGAQEASAQGRAPKSYNLNPEPQNLNRKPKPQTLHRADLSRT